MASVRLQVKVSPKAARDALLGWHEAQLKLSVTAVPERGKANAAVRELLADLLRIPKSRITLLRGDTSSQKLFEIEGLDEAELRRRIDAQTK
ncbi:hypothetical protein SAMN04488038_114114 [Solimonas aquatica]|uniref:UPF0235 protein SAMN04488038_114114 n=1 Tax=Solimonas aquatica TaxID=489703 RepID=A0A1H9L152_9GAMM|nr:DUF167 domain-containing protein [Solimonas aquatica]SER04723.1 hypothetical protein SAMN04488038_114114 [Solimonas aquatica]